MAGKILIVYVSAINAAVVHGPMKGIWMASRVKIMGVVKSGQHGGVSRITQITYGSHFCCCTNGELLRSLWWSRVFEVVISAVSCG